MREEMDKLDTLICRIRRRIRDLYYALTGRFWHRYSTIKSRHLWHTWCDKDTILEMTCFELLERFIEEESHHINWDDCVSPSGEHVMTSWLSTTQWFREVYLPYFKGEHNLLDDVKTPETNFIPNGNGYSTLEFKHESPKDEEKWNAACLASVELEARMREEMTEHLNTIVRLRSYMWS